MPDGYLAVMIKRNAEKLLVVTGADLPSSLSGYALKVALRLDLDILVLFVAGSGEHLDAGQRKKRIEQFTREIEKDAASFTILARRSEVRVTVVVDVGNQEEAVARLRAQEPSIRFILTENPETGREEKNTTALPRITVVDNDLL